MIVYKLADIDIHIEPEPGDRPCGMEDMQSIVRKVQSWPFGTSGRFKAFPDTWMVPPTWKLIKPLK